MQAFSDPGVALFIFVLSCPRRRGSTAKERGRLFQIQDNVVTTPIGMPVGSEVVFLSEQHSAPASGEEDGRGGLVQQDQGARVLDESPAGVTEPGRS